VIIRFPPRSIGAVIICRERDGPGWLTLAGAYGWLFGSLADAREEGRWLSHNLNLPIVECSS
jgi:hypothetical protein